MEKVKAKVVMPKVQVCKGVERLIEAVKPSISRRNKTSNGFEIYYDENNGDAVGIIYKNLVFLKETSPTRMTHSYAGSYCKEVVINGIESTLCQVDIEKFRDKYIYIWEFRHIS